MKNNIITYIFTVLILSVLFLPYVLIARLYSDISELEHTVAAQNVVIMETIKTMQETDRILTQSNRLNQQDIENLNNIVLYGDFVKR